jgi:hypothetical protein
MNKTWHLEYRERHVSSYEGNKANCTFYSFLRRNCETHLWETSFDQRFMKDAVTTNLNINKRTYKSISVLILQTVQPNILHGTILLSFQDSIELTIFLLKLKKAPCSSLHGSPVERKWN